MVKAEFIYERACIIHALCVCIAFEKLILSPFFITYTHIFEKDTRANVA